MFHRRRVFTGAEVAVGQAHCPVVIDEELICLTAFLRYPRDANRIVGRAGAVAATHLMLDAWSWKPGLSPCDVCSIRPASTSAATKSLRMASESSSLRLAG